jgi:RNA polymerase-binding transcription factor DksA
MTAPFKVSTDIRATFLARREELLKRLDQIAADRRREGEPLSADAPDRAIQRENDEVIDSIALASETQLREVTDALKRLDAGKYGLCKACGKEIDSARLAAAPYAEECRNCATHS